MYSTESYPTAFRASGMGSSSVFYRIGATITPLVGSELLTTGYVLPYVMFGIALIIAGVTAIFLPFETFRRNAEDVAFENKLDHDALLQTGVQEEVVPIGNSSPDEYQSYDNDGYIPLQQQNPDE